MFHTLKTVFILIRLMEIISREPSAFTRSDLVAVSENGAERAQKRIVIAKNISYNAVVEVNSHGNGYLAIANLNSPYLGVYDDQYDRAVYRNRLLNIKFADFDGDGYRDLVICGIVDFFSDDDDDCVRPLNSVMIIYIYRYNPKQCRFDEVFKLAPTVYAWGTLHDLHGLVRRAYDLYFRLEKIPVVGWFNILSRKYLRVELYDLIPDPMKIKDPRPEK